MKRLLLLTLALMLASCGSHEASPGFPLILDSVRYCGCSPEAETTYWTKREVFEIIDPDGTVCYRLDNKTGLSSCYPDRP